jgi:hypothetical protein
MNVTFLAAGGDCEEDGVNLPQRGISAKRVMPKLLSLNTVP